MKKKLLEGIIKRHPDGFGFFIPTDHSIPDVYIPRHNMQGAMTNDKVIVDAVEEKGRNRFSGDIIRIIERAITQVVGRYVESGDGSGKLLDSNNGWGATMIIPNGKSGGAKHAELVIAKVTKYPSEIDKFEGEITQVLGNADDPLHDTKRVIVEHRLPHEFNSRVEAEAKLIPDQVLDSDRSGRKDLTALPLITIDGKTAKDFDDAICVQTTEGGFRLWVAIADVSHYVKPDSAIDDEAYIRGTSTYFPNFVVPMLPEKLSNGICSLMPKVDRLALTAEMELDFAGELLKTEIYESVIKSQARVTYGEAQEVIDGFTPDNLKHVEENIKTAKDLAKILMAKRFREGSLDLEIPESQVIIDGAGYPIDIQKSERLFAHRLIEELMLQANVAVAKFLKSRNVPALNRVHEEPNPENIATLNRFIFNFGGAKPLTGGKLQKRISKALEQFKGTPVEPVINMITLRSMKQAKYSPEPLGHFGLGFDDYVHFTSPIRRYPDLVIHRQVKSLILKSDKYRTIGLSTMESMGVILSACEQRSVKAERQLLSIKKARMMENSLGEEYQGVISSVTRFGIFVLLREFDVDGLVKLDALGNDKFTFDEETLALVGKKSGLRYQIGDELRIKVASVDTQAGQIDFVLVGEKPVGNTQHRSAARQEPKKRGKAKRDRGRSR